MPIKINVPTTAVQAAPITSGGVAPPSNLVAHGTFGFQDGDCTGLEPHVQDPSMIYGGTPSAAGDKLYRVGGQWHLIAYNSPNPPSCKRTWAQTTWRDIASQPAPTYNSDPIFVGPTPIDQASITTPGNAPSEVTTLTDPSQIPSGWIPVIKEMIDAFIEGCKGKSYDFSLMLNSYTGDSSLQMPFPDTGYRIASANMIGARAVDQPGECNASTPQRCIANHSEFAYGFFPSMFSQAQVQTLLQQWGAKNTAWDGSPYTDPTGAQWWHGIDEHGNPVTFVKHPTGLDASNPYTYKVYTLYDWAKYLGLNLPETMALAFFQGYMEEELTNLQADWLGTREVGGSTNAVPNTRPPLAKWNNPAEQDDSNNPWGYWLILSELNQLTGAWDSSRDRPGQFYMFIMYSRIPQCDWWCEIVEALTWVDQLLAEILTVVAGATEQLMNVLVCNSNPQQLLALSKGSPATLAAITIIKTQCPQPPGVDCTNPANAGAVACQPPSGAVPWYVWVIGGVVVIGVVAAARSKP